MAERMNWDGYDDCNSRHSIERAKERAGLNEKKAVKMIELARKRGIDSTGCKWSLDRNYLEKRSDGSTIALAYNGCCYIFDRTSMKCITMYVLPKWFGKKKTFYKTEPRRGRVYDYYLVEA